MKEQDTEKKENVKEERKRKRRGTEREERE